MGQRVEHRGRHMRGFTIVELLIVIVVIAILAAITIVAYNGITGQAREAALKSDLKNASTQLAIALVKEGSYPSTTEGIKKSEGTEFTSYTTSSGGFCLQATNTALDERVFYVTESGAPEEGECPAIPPAPTYAFEITSTRHFEDFIFEEQDIIGTGNPGNRVILGICVPGSSVGTACDANTKLTTIVGQDGIWSVTASFNEIIINAVSLTPILGTGPGGNQWCRPTAGGHCEIHALEFTGGANPPSAMFVRSDVIPADIEV